MFAEGHEEVAVVVLGDVVVVAVVLLLFSEVGKLA